uniref:Uncharacterized protein n=1 Tax=Anguilla anguilla TaxID=7936 RepID=A0A0E9RR71_ANGAN
MQTSNYVLNDLIVRTNISESLSLRRKIVRAPYNKQSKRKIFKYACHLCLVFQQCRVLT